MDVLKEFPDRLIEVNPESVFCDWQARGTSGSGDLSLSSIADLVSSIARHGQLQPCVVYAVPDGGYQLIVGERRLRAFRWGASNKVPGFEKIQVLVLPEEPSGPDVRRWQLVENLARNDLSDGDLAQALMYVRCGLLEERLTETETAADAELLPSDDPVARWKKLSGLARRAGVAAPEWKEVISDLGLGITESKAVRVVAAFRKLPKSVTAELDAGDVSTAARMRIAKWWPEASGYVEAGLEIEEAVDLVESLSHDKPKRETTHVDDGVSFQSGGGGGDMAGSPEGIYADDEPLPEMEETGRVDRFCPQELVETLLTAARQVSEDGGALTEYDLNSLRVLFGQIFENSS